MLPAVVVKSPLVLGVFFSPLKESVKFAALVATVLLILPFVGLNVAFGLKKVLFKFSV